MRFLKCNLKKLKFRISALRAHLEGCFRFWILKILLVAQNRFPIKDVGNDSVECGRAGTARQSFSTVGYTSGSRRIL
jgi:hypothetical protein